MAAMITVILPVFLVIGFGYVAVWRNYISEAAVDGLMKFAQNFAIPCLLFRAISTLDLSQSFNGPLMVSFYVGAISGFVVGLIGARLIFSRPWEDSVAIGFVGLFSNSLLLGLPITERAFGPEALTANYAIIAVHSPIAYGVGITVMEIVRARGTGLLSLSRTVLNAMFRNALILGIVAGFVVNLSGIAPPQALTEAIDLMIRAALPAALFGLGGVLMRYRPEGDTWTVLYMIAVSLVMHPAITFGLGSALDLSQAELRSAVLTAAMAPGINCYLFANMYGVGRRVAASAVLIGTTASILTVWLWLLILP